MSWLRILVLACILARFVGVSDALDVACGDDCAESDCDDRDCPPACSTCDCARPPGGLAAPVVTLEPPPRASTAVAYAEPARVPTAPEPVELLHVPIARVG